MSKNADKYRYSVLASKVWSGYDSTCACFCDHALTTHTHKVHTGRKPGLIWVADFLKCSYVKTVKQKLDMGKKQTHSELIEYLMTYSVYKTRQTVCQLTTMTLNNPTDPLCAKLQLIENNAVVAKHIFSKKFIARFLKIRAACWFLKSPS